MYLKCVKKDNDEICYQKFCPWAIVHMFESTIDFLLNRKYNKNVLIVKQKVGVIDGSKDGKTVI